MALMRMSGPASVPYVPCSSSLALLTLHRRVSMKLPQERESEKVITSKRGERTGIVRKQISVAD